MKQYKISLDSTRFKAYLTKKGITWEIAPDYIGLVVYLVCDSDLFLLGMEYQRSYSHLMTIGELEAKGELPTA